MSGGSAQRPTIGVLAVQGDVRQHLRMLEAVGASAVPIRRAAELRGIDGVVLPGGQSTTIEKRTVVFDLLEPLREQVRAGLPAFGTCAGTIMLADRSEAGAPG